MYIFIGEKRSSLAIKRGVRWQDGKLAAKQLFDALKYSNIVPNNHIFVNWFESFPSQGFVNKHEFFRNLEGYTVVAMGRKVETKLIKRNIPHLFIYHPATRGKIRTKRLYLNHVKKQLIRGVTFDPKQNKSFKMFGKLK